jgi:hypothetical protein
LINNGGRNMKYNDIRNNKELGQRVSSINWKNPSVVKRVINMVNKEEQKQQHIYYSQMEARMEGNNTIDGVLGQVEFFMQETALYRTITEVLNKRILELTEHIKQSNSIEVVPKILTKEAS